MKRALFLCVLSVMVAGHAAAARLPRTVLPEQYKLIITPKVELLTFFGDEVITVNVTEPTREITLHASDLEIERVHVRDAERRQRAQVELSPESSTITLKLRKELVPGSAEIRISYRGPIRDDLRGLYVSRSAKDEYLFTQLQPIDARGLFPCFDEPDMKARFDLTVVVKSGEVAISNTKIISNLPGPAHGTRRIRFAQTAPMSTYMLALAVGPFDCLSGRHGETPVRFCAANGQELRGRAVFEGTLELLDFYEEWFGLPYPFQKLDVVALPDMAAGGMENPGAIFLRESWAMVDANASLEAKRWSSVLLAHEVSHLWVGDLVTMKWWSDVWLNEGLATWVSAKALRELRPDLDVSEIQTYRRMRAFDEDALAMRAVAGPVEGDESLFEIFNIVSNEKPAAMMSMVEQIAGDDAVRRALRKYLVTWSWGNASTEEFVRFLDDELGSDAANVVHDFVTKPGFPVVGVSRSCDGAKARVTFEQKGGEDETWHVPVCYRTLDGSAKRHCALVSGKTTLTLPVDCRTPLLFNPGEPGYYRVLYPRNELLRIVDEPDALTVPEKLNLLDSEWWLVTEGHHDVGDFLALIERGFAHTEHPAVIGMIISRLAAVDRQYAVAEQREEFRSWMRAYFGKQLQRTGMEPVKGESAERTAVRRELLWGAGALARDPGVIEVARRYVRDLLDDPRSVDQGLADTMIHIAARSGDDALYGTYLSRVRRAHDAQERYRFLMGLTSFTSPPLVRRTIELTLTDVVRTQDATSIVGKLLGNPDSAGAAWDVIRERWREIERRLPVTFTSERIVYGAGSFCSRERRDEVATFFSTTAAPPRALDASLARIDRCVANRASQAVALSTWLAEEGRLASTTADRP